MVIIDLIGWITFALLIVGAGWAAWKVYGDLGKRRTSATQVTTESAPGSDTTASHGSHV